MSVSLVIVSHSARLAEGVVELAGQMAQGKVAIAAAGGTSEGGLGTSVDLIFKALRQVDSPDGILACSTWEARSWRPRWQWRSSR